MFGTQKRALISTTAGVSKGRGRRIKQKLCLERGLLHHVFQGAGQSFRQTRIFGGSVAMF